MEKEFLHGLMEESIKYFKSYVGDYKDDKKHGYGEFSWPCGRKYRVLISIFIGSLEKWKIKRKWNLFWIK